MIIDIRRLRGESETKERYLITKEVLLRLLPLFNKVIRGGITMYAAFCLAFVGFLRIGEFIYSARDWKDTDFYNWFLTRRSVRLYDDHLELTLLASKIDPFR